MQWIYKIFDRTKCKKKFHPNLFLGAGNVNYWATSKHRKETRKLAKNNVNCYHIEFFSWGDSHGYDRVDDLIKKFDKLVYWAKYRKMAIFVSLINDNIHLSKYGNRPLDLNTKRAPITKALRHLAKSIKKYKHIYVQPVGETQTSVGFKIEQEAMGIIPKSNLVCNTNSRPSGVPAWASFAAFHAARFTDRVPSGLWDVTDHGTRLNEMGGTGAQVYKNDYLRKDAAKARKNNSPYVLYGFLQRVNNTSNLKAISEGFWG